MSGRIIETLTHPLLIEEVDVGGSIECGFRVSWIDGEAEGLDIELAAGAGCDSPWLTLHIENAGTKRHFRADMREFIRSFIESLERGKDGDA